MKHLALVVYLLLLLPLTLACGVVNARMYYPTSTPPGEDVVPQLHFIGAALRAGAGEDMQTLFPEGYFFTHALYGLAWVEVGLRETPGTPLYDEALREARWTMTRLEGDGKNIFSESLTPPYGVFYAGWNNWLRGGILRMQPQEARDPAEVARFTSHSDALAAAFASSSTPFLVAYPGQSWPVDNVVAVASLRLHDSLLSPRYNALIADWLAAARQKLDPAAGLLPHQVNFQTGEMIDGVRGSSQSIIGRFLVEIDPAWGREQYQQFREIFVTSVLGVPGVREYPPGRDGLGDVDSGPLIAGVSLSASVVTVAAANVNGDHQLAQTFLGVGEALGFPLQFGGQKRYALGLMPVGDAFLVWAKSATLWTGAPVDSTFPPITSDGWRLPIHILTLLFLAALWWPVVCIVRKQYRKQANPS